MSKVNQIAHAGCITHANTQKLSEKNLILGLSDVEALEGEGAWRAQFGAGPRARLGPEVAQVGLVALVQHGHVGVRGAEVRVRLVERLVAAVQQVHLGPVQLRVALLVGLPVAVAQVATQARPPLRRELAVEHQHVPARRGRRRRRRHQRLRHLLPRVQVARTLDVPPAELVRVPATQTFF